MVSERIRLYIFISGANIFQIKVTMKKGSSEAVYGLGLVGALVYYIQNADSFWAGVVGVFKALIWPAMLVHKLLGL